MQTNPTAQTRAYTTEEAANKVRNRPATWRRNLCINGHFMGIKPLAKLPNGRLLWPADQVDALLNGAMGC
jgi:hypothetical protein